MKKALLYVRVSSKEQEVEGYSLDAQEKLGLEYAKKNGLKIVRTWKVSESAWKRQRTAFNQMIEYAQERPEIEHIIFDITDRMTRNDFDKAKIVTLIKDYSKSIHFSRTNKVINKDSDPDQEFMLDIEVAVAKKMSNDISRKTKMGLQEKASQGYFPAKAPLGYYNDKNTGNIEIDQDKAPYILQLFNEMTTGQYSLKSMSERMYKLGLRSVNGKRVLKSAIEFILKNPFYYGIVIYNGRTYEGKHQPLISKDTFDQVRDVLSGKSHPRSAIKSKFAYNNILKCGVCNCKILGEKKKKKYTYYHCTFTKGRHENRAYIPEGRLEILFEDTVRKVTIPDTLVDLLKDILQQSHSKDITLQNNRERLLQGEIKRSEQRLSKLYDLMLDGDIDSDTFKQKEQEFKSKIMDCKVQLDKQNKFNPNYLEDGYKILELCNRLYPTYLNSDRKDKVRILKEIASNYILEGTSISAVYRNPYNFFEYLDPRPIKLRR